MALLIRDARREDLPALEALEGLCFSVPWTREQLESQLPDARHVFLAAEEDGRLLGYVGMMHVLDEGYISNVAVAPEARRRGVGTLLIRELMRFLHAMMHLERLPGIPAVLFMPAVRKGSAPGNTFVRAPMQAPFT